jgi:hypothetical protein
VSDFVALYRGRTVSDAQLVAVSAEPQLVRRFFKELLGKPQAEFQLPGEAHNTQDRGERTERQPLPVRQGDHE